MQGTKIRNNNKRIARPRQVALPRVIAIGDHLEGTCARWFDDRGYGWLEVDGCPDIFCGRRHLLNAPDLRRRDRVEFDLAMDHQGRYMAINVVLVDGVSLEQCGACAGPHSTGMGTPASSPNSPKSFPTAIWEDA